MTQKKVYTGVTQLRIRHSEVKLNLLFYRWRAWRQREDRVVLEGGELQHVRQEGPELIIEHFQGNLFLSSNHRVGIAADASQLTGQHSGGRIQVTEGNLDLEAPPNFTEGWQTLTHGIWQTGRDVIGIAALCLPMLAITTVAAHFTGAAPQDYADIGVLTAAGTYVGVAGRHAGSFIRATLLAAIIIYGPELFYGFGKGLNYLVAQLGLEDICKTLWFGFTWSVGSLGRTYFQRRTRTY